MTDNQYDQYDNYDDSPQKSIKGYKVVIIILAAVLAALSFLYFHQTSQLKADFAVERDTLQNNLSRLMLDLGDIRTENDSINYNLGVEREKADSLMERLSKERSFSAAKIRQYEKELGSMRQVMRSFVSQIDSLNTLNRKLITENVDYRKQISTERTRADMAEERADEMSTKIRKGAVIIARGINLVGLNARDKEVTRAATAVRLGVDLVLTANELATPGERAIYARITGPDGYIMANAGNAVFSFEGDQLTYSAVREVDYANKDLSARLYYTGGGITAGKYQVSIYMDGYLVGSNEIILK